MRDFENKRAVNPTRKSDDDRAEIAEERPEPWSLSERAAGPMAEVAMVKISLWLCADSPRRPGRSERDSNIVWRREAHLLSSLARSTWDSG